MDDWLKKQITEAHVSKSRIYQLFPQMERDALRIEGERQRRK